MKIIYSFRNTWLFCLLFMSSFSFSQITFTLTSATGNYSLTCSYSSLLVFASSNYSAAVSYSWAPPSGPVSVSNSFTLSAPGVYTVTAGSGTAVAVQTFTVSNNYNTPNLSVSVPSNILNCTLTTIQAQCLSSTPNATFALAWASGTMAANSFSVNANLAAPPSTMQIANYTVTATDPQNGCKSNTVIPFYQNIYPPNAVINSNAANITCAAPTVTLVNNSNSTIPPNSVFPVILSVTSSWFGPVPQPSLGQSASYTASTPGVYTVIATDLNNGCTSQGIKTINDNRLYPIVQTNSVYILGCQGSVALPVSIAGMPPSACSFSWNVPANANISGSNTATLTTDAPGQYIVSVKNNANGCITSATLTVWSCVGINEETSVLANISVYPNPANQVLYLQAEQTYNGLISVSLHNHLGQLVHATRLNDAENKINLEPLPAGVYYLTLKNPAGQRVVKVMKN